MTETTPLYMDINNVYSGDELGLTNRDIMGEGVVLTGDLLVTAGAGNTVNIAKGSAWVLGDTNTDLQPCYRVYNDAVVNKGVAPDPTNPRYYRVVAQINDATFSGATRNWAITMIAGTPAGAPAVPALPASALDLATILVPAAAGSSAAYTITDNRVRSRVGAGQALGSAVIYRKTTVKQIINSAAETDLLNGEITIPGNSLGINGIIRATLLGDWMNNSGGVVSLPIIKLKLGATTLIVAATPGASWTAGATRQGWKAVVEIQNLGATNSQSGMLWMRGFQVNGVGAGLSNFTTGQGSAGSIPQAGGFATYEALGNFIGATVDTTAAQVLAVTAQHSVANAALDITLRSAFVEII